ncbi:hypothetical protein Srot_0403 [Segniliparus rotundus DSM 44985]|jgi:hypothetical protein|uniref:Uncharacterized protein n=1 Tax=Segniliparus rotundus (strain ATCC BAA-972 / CDC 1076 / CIP 108378 / DSM 44985 / JCM 13578) TaxID=640132 RepID=D6ZBR3_SEGRD|nr:hypothetical protein [Segniliparus rotundus]ADG96890.1 hypothetical protein Srot_0403 [Segniliparus rotundus DSM 44985]
MSRQLKIQHLDLSGCSAEELEEFELTQLLATGLCDEYQDSSDDILSAIDHQHLPHAS